MYETRDLELMQRTIERYKFLVKRPYLYDLSCLPTTSPTPSNDSIRLLQVDLLPTSNTYNYFVFILNALAALEQTLCYLLVAHRGKLSFYIGIKGSCPDAFNLLKTGLCQTFPSSIFHTMDCSSDFLNELFNPNHYTCLSSSLAIPNVSYTSSLLKDFTNLMGTTSDYIALFLAEPIRHSHIVGCLDEFYDICNILSAFSQTNYTNYISDSKTVTSSTAKGETNTNSKCMTNTCNESTAMSHNCHTNVSASTPITLITHKVITKRTPSNKPPIPNAKKDDKPITSSDLPCANTPSSSNTPKSINSTVLFNKANGTSSTSGSSAAQADTCSHSNSNTATHGYSVGHTLYHALAFSSPNKYIQDAITDLGNVITRYNAFSLNTPFAFSTYFFSACSDVSLRAAYSYTGLSNSTCILSPNLVNSWSKGNPQFDLLFAFLRQFTHPHFNIENESAYVTNTIPILSTELINSIYFPIT